MRRNGNGDERKWGENEVWIMEMGQKKMEKN